MTAPADLRRRWFRFSLRTLLVMVAIFGTSLGWLAVQVKWIRDRHRVFQLASGVSETELVGFEGNSAPWSIRLFGEPGFSEVWVMVDDEEHPTERDQAIKRNAEVQFPEADIRYSAERFLASPKFQPPTGRMHGGGGFF
jgi:hypothetical protein